MIRCRIMTTKCIRHLWLTQKGLLQRRPFCCYVCTQSNAMARFSSNLRYAAAGIKQFFTTERNGKIQLVIGLLVIAAGCWWHISRVEWCLVLGCIGLVLGLEMLNSAIEKLCDHVTKELHPAIKTIKDMSAGAVLWAAICAAIIGVLVFYKYVIALL